MERQNGTDVTNFNEISSQSATDAHHRLWPDRPVVYKQKIVMDIDPAAIFLPSFFLPVLLTVGKRKIAASLVFVAYKSGPNHLEGEPVKFPCGLYMVFF